jgi:hypothetical protein
VSAATDDTGPQRAMTLVELHDALSSKLDENDRRSAYRHRLLVNEIEGIKATVAGHDRRIVALERSSPAGIVRPLWVAVLLLAALVAHAWRSR